jgi:folate-binding protein YgfZ
VLPHDFGLIELRGDDRLEWLQGQATNDVAGLRPGGHVAFCLCEPTGQLLAVLDAWAFEDRIVLRTERERIPAVLERVETMTILEDVAARETDDVPEAVREAAARLADPDPERAEARRIASGVPRWGADMGPRTLPPELGPAFEAAHVSYRKGCYTGQEVLMRMHSRGHTNRTWVGLVADRPMRPGEPVVSEGKEVGRIASASPAAIALDGAPAEPRYVAAATLRNEAASEGARVRVGGVEAEVRTMPMLREPA